MSTLSLEKEIALLKGVIEQLDKRLTRVENEIAELRREISQLRAEISQLISQLRSEMLTMFRWTIGIILVTWISTIVPLLLKVLGLI